MNTAIDILFVDDQWCLKENQHIINSAFGKLCEGPVPLSFHYETAENSSGGYSCKKVIDKIASFPELGAVILDIIFDLNLSSTTKEDINLGFDILEQIRARWPTLPVLMLTSVESNEDIVRAMKLGANEYLIKKPTINELRKALEIYIPAYHSGPNYAIWGNSERVRSLRALIARVSLDGAVSVLITGQSGTGKELIARAVHRQGPRRYGPFIDKNCANDSSDLLDSQLFGHEKGAFTGAHQRFCGVIERANNGVLFLDEIGSISRELQGKLLRVLETRSFQRIGGTEVLTSNFQLICATNEDLLDKMKSGELREDFYYRINTFPIVSPTLCERQKDIPLITTLFLKKFLLSTGGNYHAKEFSAECLDILSAYAWPGNIRELKNIVERMAIIAKTMVIGKNEVPEEIRCSIKTNHQSNSNEQLLNVLHDDPSQWPKQRLINELKLAVEVKRKSKSTAEFIRKMYPLLSKQSTSGLNELIKRLTKGPWGDPSIKDDPEASSLINELKC